MTRFKQYVCGLAILAVVSYGSALWSRIHGLWVCNGAVASIADFVEYYMLGCLSVGPQHLSVYNPDVQLSYQNALLSPCRLDHAFYAQYFPLAVPLLSLLSLLPIIPSYFVWALAQLVVLSLAIAWFLKAIGTTSKETQLAFTLGAVASLPCVDNFHLGQMSGLMTAAALAYTLGLWERSKLSGLGLSFLTFKIQIFFPIAAMALYLKRLSLIAQALAATLILAALACWLIGSDSVFSYPSLVLHADQFQQTGVFPERMICIRGVLTLLLGNQTAMKIALAVFAVSLVLSCILWLKTPMRGQDDLRWRIALMFTLALLVSPHTHLHDCLLMVIPAALTVPHLLLTAQLNRAQKYWLYGLVAYPYLSYLYFVPPLIDFPSAYSVLTSVFLFSLLLAGIKCRAAEALPQ